MELGKKRTKLGEKNVVKGPVCKIYWDLLAQNVIENTNTMYIFSEIKSPK